MFALPWTRDTVPHAVVELTRDCNLACRACYRQKTPGFRPLADVLADVAIIEKHQRVHTISLAGGEPTLHPELVAIVRAVKARGHRVSLVTNGLLLTDELLAQLEPAGLDIVMIHVDEGQIRPDLADATDIAQVNQLRETIAARVHAHRIAVGLCTTLYPDSLAHLPDLVKLFLKHPHINFLFATHAIAIAKLVDEVQTGSVQDRPTAGTTNGKVITQLRQQFTLEPYAFIPPTTPTADGELPCITYSIPVAHGDPSQFFRMDSGVADRQLIKLSRLIAGRYLYFTPDRRFANVIQVFFNGLFSGHPFRAAGFLCKAIGKPLRIKRLVFENAPRITPEGTVNCCDFCPNSTVRNGKVMPVCLADHAGTLNL
jgi:organic radical activating enzyme